MGTRGIGRTRIVRVMRATAGALAVMLALGSTAVASSGHRHGRADDRVQHHHANSAEVFPSATPIKHIVVVFQENRSFDRYFGTYPHALNPPGEPRFVPAPDTPTVNGLTPALLTHNPNLANPVRLGPDVGNTCGSNHSVPRRAEGVRHGPGRPVRRGDRPDRCRL